MQTSLSPTINGEAGFSLVETLIALAIVALAAFSVGTYAPRLFKPQDAAAFQERLRELLADIRSQARHKQIAIRITLRDGQFITDPPVRPALAVPGNIRIAATTAIELSPTTPSLVFLPDGSSSGARLTIIGSEERRALHVNWATGIVAAHE